MSLDQFTHSRALALAVAVKAMEMQGEETPLERLRFIASFGNYPEESSNHEWFFKVGFFSAASEDGLVTIDVTLKCDDRRRLTPHTRHRWEILKASIRVEAGTMDYLSLEGGVSGLTWNGGTTDLG